MSSNEQIVDTDHSAKRFQVCAELGIEKGRPVGKIQNLEVARKCAERRIILLSLRRYFDRRSLGLG